MEQIQFKEQEPAKSVDRAESPKLSMANSSAESDLLKYRESSEYRVVGFWIRLIAYSLDLIVISTLFFLIYSSLRLVSPISIQEIHWLGIGALSVGLVGYLYFALLTKLFSQTLGKMIMGIRVIRKDGLPLDWDTIFYREIVGRTIAQLFGVYLGYLWIIFQPQKKGWHDSISDTYVVFEEEVEQLRWVKCE